MPYEPKRIEARWQAYWKERQTFRVEIDHAKPKYYVLDMFPYPSGDGLHVGHPEGYTATDILARYKRMCGFNVLHPMGWDAFGLPAEQYAIETGTHPRETTQRNIARFRSQIEALGFSYDWSREIDTTDPRYVRWTQWIFQRLFEHGLAYQAEVPVNWCPALGTVLANEEVIDGKSERGGHPVVRLPMKQWMLRITAYADRLLEDLEGLDWPEPIKKMQRDWIGRSEGAEVRFPLADNAAGAGIDVFTTRPDTLFGATYMVLAPEHELVARIATAERRSAVEAYVEESRRKSERLRTAENREKTGVDTGALAINPCNGERVPVWIADYVLATYGTGAIMAVPAHDERDFEFAKAFGLEIRKVVDVAGQELPTTSEGVATASDFLDGLDTAAAKRRMIEWLEAEGHGKGTVTYKLRDWLFSRQRYWGEPFPVVHVDGETTLVPDAELPLLIPELDDFRPTGEQQTPLERVGDWIETTHPVTGAAARRDGNTMPQWAGSCWYFLRFCDPLNGDALISEEAERYWMPVDLYVGGAEHAVLHLLYSRFWHKFLYDIGVVHTKEPFQKLVNQGMILGSSYRYYDDNLSDAPDAAVKYYAADRVRVEEEGVYALDDGRELKARWVGPGEVARGPAPERAPVHPTIPDLPLEEVVEKMSKSRGNVINPDDVVAEYGADSMRLYEMFIGPLDKDAPWSTDGIQGVYRFLQRTWRLFHEEGETAETLRPMPEGPGSDAQARLVAQTIQGVTDDLEAMQFNTAISKLMVLMRDIAKEDPLSAGAAETFAKLLAPFAPHLAEELWAQMGHTETIAYASWPVADPALLSADTLVMAVQVNGKRRDEIEVAADAGDDAIEAAALASEAVQRHLNGRVPKKVIVVPGRLVNVVG